MYKEQEILSKIFNIGDVEYYTFQYDLPKESRYEYIKRFKKTIDISDFDKFCASDCSGDFKSKILEVFDISCPIPFYYDVNRFTSEREKNVQFSRDLKLRLLWQTEQ